MPLDIPEASPENIIAVADLVVMQPDADAAACAEFADIPLDHATRALAAGVLLGLHEEKAGRYSASDWTVELLGHGSTDQKRLIFRAHLERFEPFAYVKTRLLQGFDLLQACREARTRFDLTPSAALIRDIFGRWGAYAHCFVGDPPTVDTSLGIDSSLSAVIDPVLDSSATAEEYLSDALGVAVYVNLDRSVRDNLLLGVTRFMASEEPRSVGTPLGIAFEDYLRGIADEAGINVATKNGIGQVASELRIHGQIAKKHVGLADGVNSLRIAIAHGIDQDEGADWQISAQGVRLLISAVLLAIKSIHAYNESSSLEL